MNQAQHNDMKAGFEDLGNTLNEIRLAVNRIDTRLRDSMRLPPVIVVNADGDPEQVRAEVEMMIEEALG